MKKDVIIELKKARCYNNNEHVGTIDYEHLPDEDKRIKLSELEKFRTKFIKRVNDNGLPVDRVNFIYEQASGE